MSYRVCLVPAESDSSSAYSAGVVAARRQNGVAVAHTEGVGSRVSGRCSDRPRTMDGHENPFLYSLHECAVCER